MKEKINQKGFIQIPILIGIIVVALITLGGTGVVLHKQGKLAPLIANISEVFNKKVETKQESEIQKEVEQSNLTVQKLEEKTREAELEAERLRKEAEMVTNELEKAKLIAEAEKANAEAEKARLETEKLKEELQQAQTQNEQEKPTPNPTPSSRTEEELKITSIQVIPSTYETTIKWTTNLTSDCNLTLWPTNTQSGNLILNTYNKKIHSVDIITIPEKHYFYNIGAQTSNGKIASSDQKEFITPSDNVAPKFISVELSRPKNRIVVDFNIVTDEPVRIKLEYYYEYVYSHEDETKKEIITKNFEENSLIFPYLVQFSIPMPQQGWNDNTILKYKLTAYDQIYNSALYGSGNFYSIKLLEIPEI